MKTSTAPLRSAKLLDQLRERRRDVHYSVGTEQAYVHWVRAFIRFNGVRHPAALDSSEVETFLFWLANERKVSASMHRQAFTPIECSKRRTAGGRREKPRFRPSLVRSHRSEPAPSRLR